MSRVAVEGEPNARGLRRALLVTLVGSLVALWNLWHVDRPSLAPAAEDRPHQRLTPLDPPRFQGGQWVDDEGRPIEVGRE